MQDVSFILSQANDDDKYIVYWCEVALDDETYLLLNSCRLKFAVCCWLRQKY